MQASENPSLFTDAAAEAREVAAAFPRLGRVLDDFALKFELAARQEQALHEITKTPYRDWHLNAEIARKALRVG